VFGFYNGYELLDEAEAKLTPSATNICNSYSSRLGYLRQGNRVKVLWGDDACEEVVVPGGDLAF
jgi:hypothetical protein